MLVNKKVAWLALVSWLVLIFYLSSQPAFVVSTRGDLDNLAHIMAHMIEYGVLSFLVYNLLSFYSKVRLGLKSFLFGVIYALSDEYHQSFVATRSASWSDVLSDTLGLVVGILIIRYVFLIKSRKHA